MKAVLHIELKDLKGNVTISDILGALQPFLKTDGQGSQKTEQKHLDSEQKQGEL